MTLPLALLFFVYFCVLTIIFFQSLIVRSREKSRFVLKQKENWDCLIEEARLRGDVAAQLVATQQRVAELTPLAEEADSLRLWEVEARRHEETERAFEALSARVRQDEEEAARVRRERDQLL